MGRTFTWILRSIVLNPPIGTTWDRIPVLEAKSTNVDFLLPICEKVDFWF